MQVPCICLLDDSQNRAPDALTTPVVISDSGQPGVTWVHKGTMKGTPPLPQHGPRVFWQQSPPLFNQPRSVRNWLCPSSGRCFHRAITHLPRLNVLAAVDSYAGYKASLLAVTVATPGSTAGVFINLLFRDQVQYL